MVCVAIVGILAALALPAYRAYVERAELTQLLVQIEEIATAVRIEQAQGSQALQRGAALGKAPPRLAALTDSLFNEPGGIRLLLIHAPAGFFPSRPDRASYGLMADSAAATAMSRLPALAQILGVQPADKLWLSATQLAFPLVDDGEIAASNTGGSSGSSGSSGSGASAGSGATSGSTGSASTGAIPSSGTTAASAAGGSGSVPGATQAVTQAPATSWEGSAQANAGGTWTCSARATVRGTDGNPLGGTVGARVRVTTLFTGWNGAPGQRGWDDVMNLQAGHGSISLANLNAQAGRGEVITGCRFDVTGVDYYWPTQPAIRWDGSAASVAITPP